MSTIFAFVAVWIAVIFVLLVLDWWGNPNRGRFRPQSERETKRPGSRREKREQRRDREDAAVRSVLRDRFGRSSLRLQWSDDQETEAVQSDDDLVTMSHSAAGLGNLSDDHPRPELSLIELEPEGDELCEDEPPDHSEPLEAAAGDGADSESERLRQDDEGKEDEKDEDDDGKADKTDEHSEDEDGEDEDHEDEDDEDEDGEDQTKGAEDVRAVAPLTAPTGSGWSVGDDPMAPTRSGASPPAATVRSRVWRSRIDDPVWDRHNRDRLRAGQAPRRRNPISGRSEFAVVDTDTGIADWPDPSLDPFAETEP